MTNEEISAFALSLPEAIEDHPFGETPDVYKVANRVFALFSPDTDHPYVSLKCDPDLAELLRRKYPAITPGYHLNKRHWNSVALDGSVPDDELMEMIQHSYECVVDKLPKAEREHLRARLEVPGTKVPV